jgi:hypothetical protein
VLPRWPGAGRDLGTYRRGKTPHTGWPSLNGPATGRWKTPLTNREGPPSLGPRYLRCYFASPGAPALGFGLWAVRILGFNIVRSLLLWCSAAGYGDFRLDQDPSGLVRRYCAELGRRETSENPRARCLVGTVVVGRSSFVSAIILSQIPQYREVLRSHLTKHSRVLVKTVHLVSDPGVGRMLRAWKPDGEVVVSALCVTGLESWHAGDEKQRSVPLGEIKIKIKIQGTQNPDKYTTDGPPRSRLRRSPVPTPRKLLACSQSGRSVRLSSRYDSPL